MPFDPPTRPPAYGAPSVRGPRRRTDRPVAVALITALVALISPTDSRAAGQPPPPPCDGVAQITDVSGDGHHGSSDVLRAWLSEASGHLQAVMEVRVGAWAPEHADADINGSGFALLFSMDGQIHYVRANAPPPLEGPITYDYGTYTAPQGFVSDGATIGDVEFASPGTVTVDVPDAIGAVAGSHLTNLFVLTYDGITGGVPTWVDHAPGGTSPDDPSYGADYVVGACDGNPGTTSAVVLAARAHVTGGGNTRITGAVVPARAGVPVTLTAETLGSTATRALVTAGDGTFLATVPVRETTRLRAVAEGIGSQTLTVTVRSTVRVVSVRRSGGVTRVAGYVRPSLPGRLLLIRTTAWRPSVSIRTVRRAFAFRLRNPQAGRYQVIFIPARNRAERSTSSAFAIRPAGTARASSPVSLNP